MATRTLTNANANINYISRVIRHKEAFLKMKMMVNIFKHKWIHSSLYTGILIYIYILLVITGHIYLRVIYITLYYFLSSRAMRVIYIYNSILFYHQGAYIFTRHRYNSILFYHHGAYIFTSHIYNSILYHHGAYIYES